ncbi:MAG: dihydrolipoyl dehydrogenase family protein [bacterium]
MSIKRKYDANLIVVGAGSAGLVSAYIGAAIKAKVILIEQAEMGGDCLNRGCIPSKSLIASAKLLHQIKRASDYGIHTATAQFDFADIMRRVESIIQTIAPHDSAERYASLGVEVIAGCARLTSKHSVAVTAPDGSTRELTARAIIVAVGGAPFVPPIEGIDQVDVLTSDNIWGLRELPRRLLVLGGGPIGCELAQCFARFGSRVSVVEMLPQIMIREDAEIAAEIAATFVAEGIDLRLGHRAERIAVDGERKVLHCSHDDARVEIEFDQILVAVGRAAQLDGWGLRELDIPLSQRRTVEVNDYLQAGYPSIYACGDLVGPYQFTHAASHQAWYASVNALFAPFKKFKIDYRALPWATYTDPEVARVGLNELDAIERGVAYEVTRYDLSKLDRALTDGDARGCVKVLTVPGKDKILGATIIGAHAGDLIAEITLAMRHDLGLNKILQTIHAYPTWMEANKFLAGNWKRDHAPAWALNLLERFHRWRR